MAYERRGSKMYYYRAKKRNGRVIKQYLGRGPRAKREAQKDAECRAAREKERAERKQLEAIEAQIVQRHNLTKLLSHCFLADSGLYRHHRGEWRRRREDENTTTTLS